MKQFSKAPQTVPFFGAILAVFLGTSTLPAIAVEASPAPLVEGNSAFAWSLYGELASEEGNLFFSPYSVSSALGMTYCGARGATANEMKEALHFPLAPEQLPPAFKTLNGALLANARKDKQTLNIANGLCLTGGNVSKEFKALLKADFDAEIFPGDLNTINAWVKRRTEGKIPKILESLDPRSVCVLLNAIYFKGIWEKPFEKGRTHDAPFNISANHQVTVPFMARRGGFQILEKPDFQMVAIPYSGKHLSMVILLPKEAEGLAKLEKQVAQGAGQPWLAELDAAPAQETELSLPKYKLETDYDLVPPCKSLGIKEAFGGKADFSGMGWTKGALCIDQIKHKAFVEVNEEGTEAAAATAVGIRMTAIRQYPVFRADHPFLFLIRDQQTGTILFLGRMVNPSGK